jgi:hypothetical protein
MNVPREVPSTIGKCEGYSAIIPIVASLVSTNWGHAVIGNIVRRSPNAERFGRMI